MSIVLPLAATIVSLIFAATVLDQYFARRKAFQFVWAIGLFMFALSSGSAFWIEAWGLNETAYQLWYLFGAVLVAAYLGMGTLYLLVWRSIAHIIMAILLVASFYAAFQVFTATILDLGALLGLSGEAMPGDVRLLTPFFNIFGTIALVGGAAYSAWVFWRRRAMPHRVVSNILILVGAMLPAMGGTLSRFDVSSAAAHGLLILLGVTIIFIGFLRGREVFGFYRFPFIHGLRKVPDVDMGKDYF
jgi:glucan phosphoethanolaminetransferase (alkaline phosphatase superfamily)